MTSFDLDKLEIDIDLEISDNNDTLIDPETLDEVLTEVNDNLSNSISDINDNANSDEEQIKLLKASIESLVEQKLNQVAKETKEIAKENVSFNEQDLNELRSKLENLDFSAIVKNDIQELNESTDLDFEPSDIFSLGSIVDEKVRKVQQDLESIPKEIETKLQEFSLALEVLGLGIDTTSTQPSTITTDLMDITKQVLFGKETTSSVVTESTDSLDIDSLVSVNKVVKEQDEDDDWLGDLDSSVNEPSEKTSDPSDFDQDMFADLSSDSNSDENVDSDEGSLNPDKETIEKAECIYTLKLILVDVLPKLLRAISMYLRPVFMKLPDNYDWINAVAIDPNFSDIDPRLLQRARDLIRLYQYIRTRVILLSYLAKKLSLETLKSELEDIKNKINEILDLIEKQITAEQ